MTEGLMKTRWWRQEHIIYSNDRCMAVWNKTNEVGHGCFLRHARKKVPPPLLYTKIFKRKIYDSIKNFFKEVLFCLFNVLHFTACPNINHVTVENNKVQYIQMLMMTCIKLTLAAWRPQCICSYRGDGENQWKKSKQRVGKTSRWGIESRLTIFRRLLLLFKGSRSPLTLTLLGAVPPPSQERAHSWQALSAQKKKKKTLPNKKPHWIN